MTAHPVAPRQRSTRHEPRRASSRSTCQPRHGRPVSFGIMTAPQQVDYDDILRVWREADAIPEIEHAWLFDHLMPIGGDPNGPIFEGWTLLSALAAQTERLRLGLLVTSNRFRPPAMLAKIAATVDVVSGGRLDFGIGAGSRPSHPLARREYDGARPAVPRLRPRGREPRRGVHGHPAAVDRDRAVRLRRHLRPADRSVLQPQARPAAAPADHDRRPLGRDAARRRRARRPVEHPRRRHRRRRPPQRAAGPLLRRDRPRPRLDHPLDPPAGLLRPARPAPGTRSARRSTPASGTSSSGCRRRTRTDVAQWVADELRQNLDVSTAAGTHKHGARWL